MDPQGGGAEHPNFEVTVSDPEKKAESFGNYVTYRVVSRILSRGKTDHSSVVRRYSDFLFLQNSLQVAHPDCLIPPLPEKSMFGNLSSEFIQERKRWLQTFLIRVLSHPVLSKDMALAAFFSAEEFPPAENTGAQGFFGKLKVLKDTVNTVVMNSFEVSRGDEIPRNDRDVECSALQQYSMTLENNLQPLHDSAEQVFRAREGVSKMYMDVANGSIRLRDHELRMSDSSVALHFDALQAAAAESSVLFKEQAKSLHLHVREPVKDQILLSQQFGGLLARRETERRRAIAAASSQSAPRERLSQQADAWADKCIGEGKRFKALKSRVLQGVCRSFIEAQLEHAKQMQRVWQTALDSLDGAGGPVDGPVSGTPRQAVEAAKDGSQGDAELAKASDADADLEPSERTPAALVPDVASVDSKLEATATAAADATESSEQHSKSPKPSEAASVPTASAVVTVPDAGDDPGGQAVDIDSSD